MQLAIYVNFRGTCEEAFHFYAQHIGGRISGLVRHEDMGSPGVPPEWGRKVVHARIEIANTTVQGADIPTAEPMRSAYLSLSLDTEAEAERVYELLADGGEIFMKMHSTPFANRFAMLRDRFGMSWMLLHQPDRA